MKSQQIEVVTDLVAEAISQMESGDFFRFLTYNNFISGLTDESVPVFGSVFDIS